MLKPNGPCFVTVLTPDNQRTLVGARVQQLDGDAAVLSVDDALDVRPSHEIVVFADIAGKLHEQPAKVEKVDAAPGQILRLRLIGPPTDCDLRASHRVSVASQNIPVVVGAQPNCTLADISPEGLAVITPAPLTIGSTVDIDLSLEGIYARGSLQVSSQTKLDGGKFRHGLRAPGDRKTPIRRSLEALTNLMHRRQIQRLARAA